MAHPLHAVDDVLAPAAALGDRAPGRAGGVAERRLPGRVLTGATNHDHADVLGLAHDRQHGVGRVDGPAPLDVVAAHPERLVPGRRLPVDRSEVHPEGVLLERLELATRTDPLTQVSNRRDLQDWLQREGDALLQAVRSGLGLAALVGALAFVPVTTGSLAAADVANYEELEKFMSVYERVKVNYVDTVDDHTLIKGAIDGMLAALDQLFDDESPRRRRLVALGASAARALFGSDFRLMQQRGRVFESRWAPRTLATVHPSAILRVDDEAAKADLYRMLVDDLRLAAQAA